MTYYLAIPKTSESPINTREGGADFEESIVEVVGFVGDELRLVGANRRHVSRPFSKKEMDGPGRTRARLAQTTFF